MDFEEPDADARYTIWARALGPFEGLLSKADLRALAAVDITGGSIRSAWSRLPTTPRPTVSR